MNRERISDRATSMQNCYDISKSLTDTPLHPFPVSAEVAGDASAVESARDQGCARSRMWEWPDRGRR